MLGGLDAERVASEDVALDVAAVVSDVGVYVDVLADARNGVQGGEQLAGSGTEATRALHSEWDVVLRANTSLVEGGLVLGSLARLCKCGGDVGGVSAALALRFATRRRHHSDVDELEARASLQLDVCLADGSTNGGVDAHGSITKQLHEQLGQGVLDGSVATRTAQLALSAGQAVVAGIQRGVFVLGVLRAVAGTADKQGPRELLGQQKAHGDGATEAVSREMLEALGGTREDVARAREARRGPPRLGSRVIHQQLHEVVLDALEALLDQLLLPRDLQPSPSGAPRRREVRT